MRKVNFTVNGRGYSVACKEGEEDYVLNLAQELDRRAAAFREKGEPMSDTQTLLLVALSLLDELSDNRETPASAELMAGLKDVTDRMEKLANAANNR